MAQTAIELSNVSKKYNQAGYFAVDHVSLSIEEGSSLPFWAPRVPAKLH